MGPIGQAGRWEWATDGQGSPVLDTDRYYDIVRSLKMMEELGAGSVGVFDLSEFGINKKYITIPGVDKPIEIDTQAQSGKTNAEVIPGTDSTLVTLPDGTLRVVKTASSASEQYSLMAQQSGGVTPGAALTLEDYARGDAPQDDRGLAPGGVIENIVPGYHAIQTSEGKYQIVSAAEGADKKIGDTINLPDGRDRKSVV